MQQWLFVLAASGLCTVAAGCFGNGELPVHPVSGAVFYQGQPAGGALVIFHPKQPPNPEEVKRPSARVQDDGTFTLTSRQSGDGAPLGDYDVTIVWFGEEGRQESSGSFGAPRENAGNPDRLKGKYANPATSGLAAVTIQAGANELPRFDLE